jgi:hypothetical protein
MNNKLGQEPAFPVTTQTEQEEHVLREGLLKHGMNKRLYIATKAMQGLLSANHYQVTDRSDAAFLSRKALIIADELLKHESE